ncbi:MAG: 50S ribosomal protein L30 [Acidobacteria bacterium]|nr:MAG: 50S ribosomal protein L30 [Acidobacteriota bacterium]
MVAKKKKADAAPAKIKIQYYRSTIAFPQKQKEIVRSLGLRKLNQVVERPDTASMRGAVEKVPHLLRIIE